MIPAIIVICILIFLVFLFLAPGHASKEKKAPFYGRNIAHRGLYDKDQAIPENSLPAFIKARENGYGIELDVQLSKDGQVVVFHDDTLDRACGVDARVDSLDYAELEKLSLFSTEERIPLFCEVLEAFAGEEPMIVELKNGPRNEELCKKTLELLRGYKGEYCIESFNPLIVAWFRKHAPDILRGQLAQQVKEYGAELKKIVAFILGNTLFNISARPHFIAYKIGKKPLTVKLSELLGAMKVCWTSHEEKNEKDFDVVIFEHYHPLTVFKKQ